MLTSAKSSAEARPTFAIYCNGQYVTTLLTARGAGEYCAQRNGGREIWQYFVQLGSET